MTISNTWLRSTGLLVGALAIGTGSALAQETAAASVDTAPGPLTAKARQDSARTDSTKWGYQVDRQPEAQNPPGYRGLERPAGLDDTSRTDRRPGDSVAGAAAKPTGDRDRVDIIHQKRRVAPGVGHQPPPYPSRTERVWVERRPGEDSVSLDPEAIVSEDSAWTESR